MTDVVEGQRGDATLPSLPEVRCKPSCTVEGTVTEHCSFHEMFYRRFPKILGTLQGRASVFGGFPGLLEICIRSFPMYCVLVLFLLLGGSSVCGLKRKHSTYLIFDGALKRLASDGVRLPTKNAQVFASGP